MDRFRTGAQVHVTIGRLPPALPDERLRQREVGLSGGSVRRGFPPPAVLPCGVAVMMISVYYLPGRRADVPSDILSPNPAAAPIALFSAAAHEPGLASNSRSSIVAPGPQVPAQFAQQLYGKPAVLPCDPYLAAMSRKHQQPFVTTQTCLIAHNIECNFAPDIAYNEVVFPARWLQVRAFTTIFDRPP